MQNLNLNTLQNVTNTIKPELKCNTKQIVLRKQDEIIFDQNNPYILYKEPLLNLPYKDPNKQLVLYAPVNLTPKKDSPKKKEDIMDLGD